MTTLVIYHMMTNQILNTLTHTLNHPHDKTLNQYQFNNNLPCNQDNQTFLIIMYTLSHPHRKAHEQTITQN